MTTFEKFAVRFPLGLAVWICNDPAPAITWFAAVSAGANDAVRGV